MRPVVLLLMILAVAPLEAGTFGGFVDVGYLLDSNHPANHLFRSRGTTFHVDEWDVEMVGLYVRKPVADTLRWGGEFTLHAGKDSEVFGFSASAPNFRGANRLRHLGPTGISYLAPLGKGLTIQSGIFNSLIGYDSLYAKDNFNYTRPWGADFTPYLMMGVNVSYPISTALAGTAFVVNGYWHLANANRVPSSGGQLAYKASDRCTLKQTFLYGPHQADTSLEFWRFLADSIVEWKSERVTIAFESFAGGEKIADAGESRAIWMSGQLPIHAVLTARSSVTVRPEVYWDRNGRTTGSVQLVKAVTSTVEYRVPRQKANAIVRLEYRYDDSRGKAGGFFRDRFIAPNAVGLKQGQQLLIFGAIVTFESPLPRPR
ncbi:MAG: hypothetical protein NVSMB68_08490 [Thermoanaerobaculia bacterium]